MQVALQQWTAEKDWQRQKDLPGANQVIHVGYEIGSHEHTHQCGFHNQAMTITLLYERQYQ